MTTERSLQVAILTENGFEQEELTSPKAALEGAGIGVDVISPRSGKVKAWDHTDWGIEVEVDKNLSEARVEDYDALVLPGGVMNPDKLRMDKAAVSFVKDFVESGKPVAAICHGPQVIIETGLLKGKRMTSYSSLQTDMKNAGANWVDEACVEDGNLITSRKPDDLPVFNKKLVQRITRSSNC